MNTHTCASLFCNAPATMLMVQRNGTSALFGDGAALVCRDCVPLYEDRATVVKLGRDEKRYLGW